MLWKRAVILAGLVLAVLTASAKTEAATLEGTRPNIVLVITDDQGYGQIGRLGHPWLKTPNLNQLYDQSTHFTRFLVSPTCAPTRSALMTGRHPMQNGVTHTVWERERMTLDAVTLPQMLNQAGYHSAIFGKWHLGDEDEYQPHNRGFEETFIHGAGGIGQAYECSCADAPDNSYFNPVIKQNGKFVQTNGYCTDLFFTAALGFIKKQSDADEPFFAYIATNAPHSPFNAPPKNTVRFEDRGFSKEHAGFYGMVENIDENVGRLLTKLTEWNLDKNTVVIFMSDNGTVGNGMGRAGTILGKTEKQSAMYPFNAGMKGAKGSVDEGGVRVPFFIRWTDHIQAGQDIHHIAAHIDLVPTLTALAGVEYPEAQVTGRNLLPLIESQDRIRLTDRFLFTHKGRWPTGAEPNDFQWKDFAVRNQRFRFVNNSLLFDMEKDPGQTNNVIGRHPRVVEEMRNAYDEWWKETRPMMVNEDAPMSPTRPFHVQYYEQKEQDGIPQWEVPEL